MSILSKWFIKQEHLKHIVVFTIIMAVHTSPSHSAEYSLIDLGRFVPKAVNKYGNIAGVLDSNAAIWQSGTTTLITAGKGSYAVDINDSNIVVGMTNSNNPFIWQNGVINEIICPNCTTAAINSGGTILGTRNVAGIRNIYKWHNGIFDSLIQVPNSTKAIAFDINNSNDVLGRITISGFNVICRWLSNSVRWGTALNRNLDGDDKPAKMNDSGDFTGFYFVPNASFRAFAYIDSTLFTLNGIGIELTYGYDINNLGTVVGKGSNSGASVWIPNSSSSYARFGIMQLASTEDQQSWNILSDAFSINNAGDIVGIGTTKGGEIHGFLLKKSINNAIQRKPFFNKLASQGITYKIRNDILEIVLHTNGNLGGLSIFDPKGRIVLHRSFNGNTYSLNLKCNLLSSGLYVFNVYQKNCSSNFVGNFFVP